jgi:hypothetical protein
MFFISSPFSEHCVSKCLYFVFSTQTRRCVLDTFEISEKLSYNMIFNILESKRDDNFGTE